MQQALSIHYAALFWFIGYVVTYWPRWLQDRGFDSTEIGLILAAAVWMKIPLNLTLGRLSRRTGERRLYIRLLALIVLLALPLFWLGRSFELYLLLWAVAGASITALIPLTDSISVTLQQKSRFDYGRARLWGSMSFIVAAILGGWVLGKVGIEHTLTLMLAGALALLVTAALLPDLRSRPARNTHPPAGALLASREFLLFLAVVALTQSSHAVLYGFASIHWRSAGHSEAVIGWLWAEGVIAEIIIFFFAARFTGRLGPWRLLMLGSSMATVRWIGLASTSSLGGLVVLQWLHAFSFALTHLGMMEFIRHKIAGEATTSAQTLVDAVALGLAFGTSMLLAGLLYGAVGASGWYAMAVMTALAFILATTGRFRFRNAGPLNSA